MELWYRKPAGRWSEALPIGNGRLGGMVSGGVSDERIWLNEDSIWSGGPQNRINPDAKAALPEIRRLLRQGKIRKAQKLALTCLSGTPISERAYLPAGELLIHMDSENDIPPGQYGFMERLPGDGCETYRRALCMDAGTAEVTYKKDGITYRRICGISFPDQCLFVRLTTEEKAPFSFSCRLSGTDGCQDESGGNGKDGAHFSVDAPEGGIPYYAAFRVKATGGRIYTQGETVLAENVTEAVIYLDIETGFRHRDLKGKCEEVLERAVQKDFDALYEEHCRDFGALYSRMSLAFTDKDPAKEELPTDERLMLVKEGDTDTGLLEQYFQFARYLMISGSRPGSLPLNLQGIWNRDREPSWGSKFTININAEMNYWMAEEANLSECHLPFFDLLENVKENGKRTAREMYGCRGSAAHHNTDIHGDTAPQDTWIPGTYWVMGEAWMASHIRKHTLYTNDLELLKKHFDVLEQSVEFFEDFLIPGRDGYLVTSPSCSPENTYEMENGTRGCLCEGSSMDMEILTDLFTDYIEAGRILGISEEKLEKAEDTLRNLRPLQIGRDGRLLEWEREYREPEPGHRHISHLYGVYPGRSITKEKTPELMEAAKKSLEYRLSHGGGHTGWSRAWIIVFWACFGEGEKAFANLQELLAGSTFPNLMDTHPVGSGHVFQIDGNMGAAAGMLEMLARSRQGELTLLPAVSREISSGILRGMKICGGASLDMEWHDCRVTSLRILPEADFDLHLSINGEERDISLQKNVPYVFGN